MAIRVNGKDMKDAVIKTEQFDMQLLDLVPESMKVSIHGTAESFSFVPRFITITYPDTRVVNARDAGIVSVRGKETVETTIVFAEKLRLERMMTFELRYSRKKIADISID